MPVKAIVVGKHSKLNSKIIVFEFGIGTDGKPTEVGVDDETLRVPLPRACTFKRWTLNGVLPPTGTDGKVDILLNGLTIFDSSKITYTDGDTSALIEGVTFETTSGAKDDKIYAKITAVGTTYAGKGWLVTLEFE